MSEHQVTTEARKVVTVLFSDIQGSTQLGEVLDPESLRDMMSRYFAEVRRVIERHEGVVEKFIGDAVVAVFGLPRVHEDDALRAVRAAEEIRTTLAALNGEFAAIWGVTVLVRTGINTGEILARERPHGESIVLGDAVNVAARLEQEAEPGEILIGEATYRLVHDAVTAEDTGPLTLKGKAAPVPAWRLLRVAAHAPGWSRRLDSPLVGRGRELADLERAFGRAADRRTCELVTVMGPAGVGKSRLTAELLSGLGAQARVLQGRCLPYGEGITFWPMVSVLMQALDIGERDPESEARRRMGELVADESAPGDDAGRVADALAPLLGFGAGRGIQETYWAVRRLLERLAARGPIVVAFDDIHWAEPTFLDLVEYLGDWMRSVPVLMVCQARPELLEIRPSWLTAKDNATLVALRPLNAPESDTLIRGLVGDAELPPRGARPDRRRRRGQPAVRRGDPPDARRPRRAAVAGRPLERQRRPVRGHDPADDPRIDHRPAGPARGAEQRAVVERGSVVGRSFWWGAVTALSAPAARPGVAASLQALVRKDLIEPDRSEIVAGGRVPLHPHPRPGRRLPRHPEDGPGVDARAARRVDRAPRRGTSPATTRSSSATTSSRRIARSRSSARRPSSRARSRPAPPGRSPRPASARSHRGDMPAAVSLLGRAGALLPEHDPRRLELLPELAFALMETADFDRLVGVSAESWTRRPRRRATPTLRAHATVVALGIRVFTDPEGWAAEAERVAAGAIRSFGELEDERGLGRAWSLLGLVRLMYARFGPAEEAWSQAAVHARRAGRRREALESLAWVPLMLASGPTPAEEGIRRCREVFAQAEGDRKVMSSALFSQADFEAFLGRFDEARDLLARARALLEEVALPVWAAGPLRAGGRVDRAAGGRSRRRRGGAPARLRHPRRDRRGRVALDRRRHPRRGGLRPGPLRRGHALHPDQRGAGGRGGRVLPRALAQRAGEGPRPPGRDRGGDPARQRVGAAERDHRLPAPALARPDVPGGDFRLAGRAADADAAADEAVRVATAKGNVVGARLAREARGRRPGVEAARRA